MNLRHLFKSAPLAAFVLCSLSRAAEAPVAGVAAAGAKLTEQPAVTSPGALKASMLAVARAGRRIVAVGDRGVVLISDDDGATFRQARSVPTRAALTAVVFSGDGKTGWAAGHLGVILGTTDAGDSWTLERDDTGVDQPLFTIGFSSASDGIAAGLWSLAVATHDGGKSWKPMALPKMGKDGASAGTSDADAAGGGGSSGPNLFSVFASSKGTLLIAGEQGLVYRSVDAGTTWTIVQTGGRGTLWTGLALREGGLLVAGLSGKIFRSDDDGQTWKGIDSTTKSSITALSQLADGRIIGVGLDGVIISSDDGGLSFKSSYQPERTALTAVIEGGKNVPLIFSVRGPQSVAVTSAK
jgi:photosystem II stability/assembly factor-like uncharacterized protein